MTTNDPYAVVLADLKAKRAQLDAAIQAIESIAGGMGTGAASTSIGPGEIPDDAFFGMSILDAAVKFLGIVKRPQTPSEIADALLEGGFTSTSKSLANTVFTTLTRAEERGGEVVKVDRRWGLAAWYPGRTVKKKARAANGEPTPTDGAPSEPEQPSEQSLDGDPA